MRPLHANSFVYLHLIIVEVSSMCYDPNGKPTSLRGDNNHIPCNSDPGSFSMCCANKTDYPDICLPNGLCKRDTGSSVSVWRDSCSDPTWSSPFCLQGVCTNFTAGGSNITDSIVTQCTDDGSWCCGGMTAQTCCEKKNEYRFFLADVVGLGEKNILGTPTSSIYSTASTPSAGDYSSFGTTSTIQSRLTATTVVASVSSSENHPSTTRSTSAAISSASNQQNMAKIRAESMGIGFGIGFAFFLLVSLLTYYGIFRRKQNRERAQATISNGVGPEIYDPEDSARPELGSYQVRGIDNRDKMLHVNGAWAKAELHGRGIERFEVEGQSSL